MGRDLHGDYVARGKPGRIEKGFFPFFDDGIIAKPFEAQVYSIMIWIIRLNLCLKRISSPNHLRR